MHAHSRRLQYPGHSDYGSLISTTTRRRIAAAAAAVTTTGILCLFQFGGQPLRVQGILVLLIPDMRDVLLLLQLSADRQLALLKSQ